MKNAGCCSLTDKSFLDLELERASENEERRPGRVRRRKEKEEKNKSKHIILLENSSLQFHSILIVFQQNIFFCEYETHLTFLHVSLLGYILKANCFIFNIVKQ